MWVIVPDSFYGEKFEKFDFVKIVFEICVFPPKVRLKPGEDMHVRGGRTRRAAPGKDVERRWPARKRGRLSSGGDQGGVVAT